jgi:hypothetical protein
MSCQVRRRVTMPIGSSDKVRSVALEKYLRPAMLAGKTHFSVAVKDLMKDLQSDGFPAGNYPQICTAIRTGKFLREQGLEIEGIDGPPSGLSPTVVVRYKVADSGANQSAAPLTASGAGDENSSETPAARAYRLTERLCGLLKEELAEYGGGEAFIRWIRSEDDAPPPGPAR